MPPKTQIHHQNLPLFHLSISYIRNSKAQCLIFHNRIVQRRNAIWDGDQLMNLRRTASDESLATLASCQVRIKRSATSVYDSRRNSIASMESCMTLQQSELDRLGKVYESTISKSKRKSIKNRLKNFSSRRRRRSFGGGSRQSSFTYVLITCFHESRIFLFVMVFFENFLCFL
jgi:hypothetical protein